MYVFSPLPCYSASAHSTPPDSVQPLHSRPLHPLLTNNKHCSCLLFCPSGWPHTASLGGHSQQPQRNPAHPLKLPRCRGPRLIRMDGSSHCCSRRPDGECHRPPGRRSQGRCCK
ncbi:hypothetical protein CC85DRAFT_97535 [Cutaneotrichosporon oleaginosum]|uniref:Uncharacterized protein n=1 Tax=Cutaneotrichosporon oleaginosum TaxID=879819 RepID=A0A0J0XM55_9TREE|nr:uncharacterized protein CC85DRAFT_97535 [Cutaneotrichosporon oleaginosum]KLT42195.1 hypothetical protein CC85DRAFT_97535 [Cutaneotrichosporon oleaginosum]TXT11686.1 hypothetical protein COLE_02096 [Cutaneotrichosporon oleaginosum]